MFFSIIALGALVGASFYFINASDRQYQFVPEEQELLLNPIDIYQYLPLSWVGYSPRRLANTTPTSYEVSEDSPHGQQQQMLAKLHKDYRTPPPPQLGEDPVWLDPASNARRAPQIASTD